MGATFSRVKNWAASETLTRADLNAEFDNILTYLTPSGIDDYSTNASAMQTQTDPGSVGSESLATSLAGEIERLRFAIKRIAGETYWYTAPDSSIAELSSALGGGLPGNRVASGRASANSSQPLFLVPHGTNRTVSIEGATTNLVYYIGGTQYTISTAVTSGTLTAAPSSNNTCLVNEALSADQTYTKLMGEYGTSITVDNMGSEISALVGKLAAFSINNGSTTEYFIAKVESTTELRDCVRGTFFSSADAIFPRIVYSDNDTITLMKLTWVFANTSGAIAVCYTNPRVGKDEPSSPAVGDYWFDTSTNTWKTFNSSAYVAANATLVGICMQNTTATIAARGVDFFKNHSATNNVELRRISNTEVRSKNLNSELVVYGTTLRYPNDYLRWDITADLDSGVAEAASTQFYCYVKETGETIISDVAPRDNKNGLYGHYHPKETWRCVGSFFNDASQNIVACNDFNTYNPNKYTIAPSVASNDLTINIYDETGNQPTHVFPLHWYFQSDTESTGGETKRLVFSTLTLTVPNTATLGSVNGIATYYYLFALNQSYQPEIAIRTTNVFTGGVISTTAVSTSADSAIVYYSTTARTNVRAFILGRIQATEASAGVWATAPSHVHQGPLPQKRWGTLVSKSEATDYQALSDGVFIMRSIVTSSNTGCVRRFDGLTDTNTTPTTVLASAYFTGSAAAQYADATAVSYHLPVKAGEYYRGTTTLTVGSSTQTTVYYWQPLE